MTILATSKTQRLPGPPTKINCPNCGPDSPAKTYQLDEKMGLYFIHFLTQRETFVECNQCGLARLTRLPLIELDCYSANDLEPHLYQRVSFVIKFLTVAGVLLFFVPFLPLAFGLTGFFAARKAGGWVKVTSIGVIIVSTVTSLFWLAFMLTRK